MSDLEEMRVAFQRLGESMSVLADAIVQGLKPFVEVMNKAFAPFIESSATVLDDVPLALPEPMQLADALQSSYPDERKRDMELDREERGE